MPTSRKKPQAKRSKGRAAPASRGGRGSRSSRRSKNRRASDLQIDLAGVALVIFGCFLAAIVWGGWEGGPVGAGLEAGFEILIGKMVLLLPLGLIGAGVLVIAREQIPGGLPLRTGMVLLLLGLCLSLALGALGVIPGDPPASWEFESLRARGGALGQALLVGSTYLVSDVGAGLVALFLVVAGIVLASGVSIGSIANTIGAGAADATRSFGRSAGKAGSGIRRRAASRDRSSGVPPAEAEPVLPPEPEPQELVVRATHVEAGVPPEYEEVGHEDGPAFLEPPEPEPVPFDIDAEAGSDSDRDMSEGAELTPMGRYRSSVVDDPDFRWRRPPRKMLVRSKKVPRKTGVTSERELGQRLIESLGHHGVDATLLGAVSGPHITRYELRLAPGIKMSKVANLRDDLAYALASTEIRILAPIPGKQAVGVEVPNTNREMVTLGDVWQEAPSGWSPLTVWLGKDVAGRAIGADLARMPHLLVAGTTGAGKSGCVNAMLSSVLLRSDPKEVRLVLVDPKQVELNHYEGVPHLLTPVITNPKQAANALANLVREMESRYSLMSLSRTRGLGELNEVRVAKGEPPLPYILCVIDELADLMMVAPGDVEDSIIRLAQKARAVGIHLVLATQSPRVDVITGMIKANVPSRIAFAVSSQTDSRVILDQNGAESLLGQGDMLFSPVGSSKLQRIQGAYIDEEQIAEICGFWRSQGEPSFNEELLAEVESEDELSVKSGDEFDPDDDPLLDDAIALVAQMQTASTSMMQRRLRVGYTRAGRLIDMLERRGIISGYEGSKPRQVLITEADLPRVIGAESAAPTPAALVDDESSGA